MSQFPQPITHWKTRDGREIEISKMGDNHLMNTIRMLKKRGFEPNPIGEPPPTPPNRMEPFLAYAAPQGEMAQMAWEQAFDEAMDQDADDWQEHQAAMRTYRINQTLAIMLQEASDRGLKS